MISLINFGASPFRALFYVVAGIFVLTLLANVVAALLTHFITRSTAALEQRR